MLEREDFYKINQETLNYFYTDDLHESILYIYPQLNAIVTKKPSKEVKRYLYVEYNVKSSFLKKVLQEYRLIQMVSYLQVLVQ